VRGYLEQPIKLVKSTIELLEELGLRQCSSAEPCCVAIAALRLRQLDRLKMALSKLAREEFFSEDLNQGIGRNDFNAFSLAVLQLNAAALENAN
jgi:hypothetical protein